ncbi:MAG: hypothetical protein GY754_33975 [bacterium]|nr:hypothetical protein [bacterium]
MFREVVDSVYDKIVLKNRTANKDSIPHSDDLFKECIASHGLQKAAFDQIIALLKDAHKILIIGIAKEDKNNDTDKIDGFVEADLYTIKKLKDYFENLLAALYEEERHVKMGPQQVIREIFPNMSSLNNTPMGYIGNKAIMLGEYEKLLQKEFSEFTEEWKEKKLSELVNANKDEFEDQVKDIKKEEEKEEEKPKEATEVTKRAVDSDSYSDFSSLNSSKSLNKVLAIYGVEFFFRVNLRKYNFELIRQVVESRMVDRKPDLQLLKTMVQNLKKNIDKDPKLLDYSEEVYKLERAISRYMVMRRR